MNQPAQGSDDQAMIAAEETARRNPMRPPDTLPRDRDAALKLFWTHPSPLPSASAAGVD